MTTLGTRIPDQPNASAGLEAHGNHTTPAKVLTSDAKTPYWLLWSTGIVAFVIGAAAFVLWGVNGVGTLFDMIVALCT